MNYQSADYVFGADQTELERLLVQAEGLEPEARWLLAHVGVERGWRAADFGCGPIGVLDLLSACVGETGQVVGIEREERFTEMARRIIKHRKLDNVRIILGDALGTSLERESFDLVHERLVLINVPEASQKALITEMLALLKVGGIIALQDYDRVSYVCYPEHPSWTLLRGLYDEAFRMGGGSGATGRMLTWLLRAPGVRNVRTKVHVRTVEVGESRRTHHLSMLEVMHDKILALGKITEQELRDHKKALLQHLSDPDTLLIDRLLVQAWGVKPPPNQT